MTKVNVGVLISGHGSNLQALIDAAAAPDYPAQIALVISNKEEAYGLARASAASIPSLVIDHNAYASREAFDRAMHAALQQQGIEMLCLAGFMRLLSPWFVRQWSGRALNIHPSLLPAFKGAHAVRDALAAGVAESGCTVHVVSEELDAGRVIKQERVSVLPGDTQDSLHRRIHLAEHRTYPAALAEFILQSRNR